MEAFCPRPASALWLPVYGDLIWPDGSQDPGATRPMPRRQRADPALRS
jgi:hypothetical protein